MLLPGRSFYVWGGYANCANYPGALAESGLYFSQAIIWDKQHPVLTRKDYMGAHEWCQPAGTMVDTRDGPVPIESLVDGDRVVAYSRHNNMILGRRKGSEIIRTSRPYAGDMLGVVVGGKATHCTPGHFWSARLTEDADRLWCTYLMRKGRWWRVGKSMLLSSWGFGLKHRLYAEGGDEAWILSIHTSSVEAAVEEQFILAKYGIPTLTWADRNYQNGLRQIEDLSRVYGRLDLDAMEANAFDLLEANGRYAEFPIVTSKRDRVKVSRRVPFKTRARHRCRCCGNTFAANRGTPYHRLRYGPGLFDRVHAERFSDETVRNVQPVELQVDELRSFHHTKKRPMWVHSSLEVWSRLWTSVHVGKRTLRDLRVHYRRLPETLSLFGPRPLITTDGFRYNGPVISRVFGPRCVHAQVVKRFREGRVFRVWTRLVLGPLWALEEALERSEDSRKINTAYIERLNLTIRRSLACLQRKTTAYARSAGSLLGQLELLRCYYNFVRPHSSLRCGREVRTPAMQAGLVDHRMTFREVFTTRFSEARARQRMERIK